MENNALNLLSTTDSIALGIKAVLGPIVVRPSNLNAAFEKGCKALLQGGVAQSRHTFSGKGAAMIRTTPRDEFVAPALAIVEMVLTRLGQCSLN